MSRQAWGLKKTKTNVKLQGEKAPLLIDCGTHNIQ